MTTTSPDWNWSAPPGWRRLGPCGEEGEALKALRADIGCIWFDQYGVVVPR